MFKKIKQIYTYFLILTYGLNFFGGGFFYSYFILRNENEAVFCTLMLMFISLCLYVDIYDSKYSILDCVKSFKFNVGIIIAYLLPFVMRAW